MAYYNIVTQSNESTVVAEYTASSVRNDAYQSEADLEREFIALLKTQGYEYLPIHTEADLIANLRKQLEGLNGIQFTDSEWNRFFSAYLANPNESIVEKTRKIQEGDSRINFKRDDGLTKNIALIDKADIHANKLQVINQYDVTVLVNGLPLVHIELKRRGVAIREAFNQINRYQRDSFWAECGLFEFVQVFVISNGTNTKYYSNTTRDNHIRDAKRTQSVKKQRTSNSFEFTSFWADANNRIIPDLIDFTKTFFSKHTLLNILTKYCVFSSENMLLVMRPYQIAATEKILNRIEVSNNYKQYGTIDGGGYIWHTTGSGKTMTSFKSAQLIASSKDADKVIFLMDRIELGTQSLKEYRGFADENESVQATENTNVLITKLKSSNPADTLIVTSIQKMSNIKDEAGGLNARDIELISEKRIVFIVDEAHRSTFGDMLLTIKNTFPKAMFFGFTGTPIQDENQKKKNTTSTVFGNELHRYSIADGIRDKNVLGFDPYKVLTFKDKDVRKVVALEKAKAQTEEEAISDPVKSKIFYKYMDVNQVGMVGHFDAKGDYIKGIEDYIPNVQYTTTEHTTTVVKDILENWVTLSHNSKFHAIFATSSIPEAINYYRLFKELNPQLKVTALFDPSIDNNGGVQFKEDGLVEIISDYNEKYGQDFAIPTFAKMKKDIAARLAHKKPYERVATEPAKQIDLLIVVDQMLTGFDSKWINTLYMDKVLQYENIIQAFSRTNRLFGPDKPFGTIRYYRKPHTMEHNINAAVKLYSGDRPLGLFVQHLVENLKQMNELFESITELFTNAGIENFEKLPNDTLVCRKFAKDFNEFNSYLEAAKIQGFKWDVPAYVDEETGEVVDVAIDENTYLILVLRYKELTGGGGGIGGDDVPYDLAGYITEIDTGLIDSDYMNSRFDKYIKLLSVEGTTQEAIEQAETELHKTFATLSQEEQKYANIFLHDIQRGDVKVSEGKSLRDYINEYLSKARNDQIHRVSSALGLDENLLRNIMSLKLNENNLNEFGRYDELKKTVDKAKAKEYFEKVEGTKIIPPKVNVKVDKLLRDFIISGGYEIQMPTEDE